MAAVLTGILSSNIAKNMNKVVWPSLHKTRVIRRRPFRFGWLSSLDMKVLITILSSSKASIRNSNYLLSTKTLPISEFKFSV